MIAILNYPRGKPTLTYAFFEISKYDHTRTRLTTCGGHSRTLELAELCVNIVWVHHQDGAEFKMKLLALKKPGPTRHKYCTELQV